jgi:hypothetical protein
MTDAANSGRQGDFGALAEAVIVLDMALTGRREADARQAARSQARLLADPIGFAISSDGYYLSDGGYSRLLADEEGNLRLSGVSRDAVKGRWRDPDVREIAGRVEDSLRAAIAAELGEDGPPSP